LALSNLKVEIILKVPLALLFSGITAGIIYSLIGNTLKNIRETGIYLKYVDPTEKLVNFREFEDLDFQDKVAAQLFYESMRAKRDYAEIETSENKLDKTEQLLAIDFLLGRPGTLNEVINKLCLDPNCSLSKEGVYRVLGEILSASPDNIKKDITTGVKRIRSGKNQSDKRIDQLRNVKTIFFQSKLALKADEIDRLIEKFERLSVQLKYGINGSRI